MGKWLLRTALLILFLHQVVARLIRRRWPAPAPAVIGPGLDSRLRHLVQSPESVVARSGIARGDRVLEIGCGSGAFTLRTSETAGPDGHVVALDIQAHMLSQLARKLARAHDTERASILPVRANAHHLPFADGEFDVVTMVTVLPEIPDPERALAEVIRVLRPGGTLAITEFLPDPDYRTRRETVSQAHANGFMVNAVEGSAWSYTARCIVPPRSGQRMA